ncbi:eukaryotic translation initiation factor 4 gamma 1 isoform X2 [Syngnathus scovelli]|uniref:eukaryotic translation initiation factor 4 gamma 1 isoform X2 n=1 Tax=Syngnathus scovelli TaxID=161590 RepID=UPI0021109995|nr:eukaryotic translation initiation factor 4 gamma 1 isoform X2 [Syngnathus scovelli]
MNKAPQPVTGPPSNPHPAPSPGLSQPSFPSGLPSVVFATPQMNPTPQPYYANRTSLPPSSGPRCIPPSSNPRPVASPHVYQPAPGSQMMMIPGQQLPFPSSPQGAAYFIQGQYRSPTYVATPQQYSVPAGAPGFYPGTSPAEYGSYAGAYYTAQPQFTPTVQAPTVLMNPAPQQQQPPPQPPQHIHTKRERKQIRIRDPKQGGRDITEEIMSGGRSGSTPTPPQTAISGSDAGSVQANGESTPAAIAPAEVRADDSGKPLLPSLSPPPDSVQGDLTLAEAPFSDINNKPATSSSSSEALETPVNTICISPPASIVPITDRMYAPRELSPEPQPAPEVPAYPAPLPDFTPTSAVKENLERKAKNLEEVDVVIREEIQSENASSFLDTSLTRSSSTNGVAEDMPEIPSIRTPSTNQESPLESPIAQPEELSLSNGVPLPSPQDMVTPVTHTKACDDSPIAEPDVCLQPVINPPKAINKPVPTSLVESTTAPVAESVSTVSLEAPVEAITQAASSQTEGEQTVPPVSQDTDKVTPMPQHSIGGATSPPLVADSKDDHDLETLKSPAQNVLSALVETPMQAAVSVPKKKRKIKDFNKKEIVGDLLDAFKEDIVPPEPEAVPTTSAEIQLPAPSPASESNDLTWEDKEDKVHAENIQPNLTEQTATNKEYQYKEEQWKPINPEEKKKYDRKFLLGFQFISASMNKPEGLPAINDVVLDKANKTPLRQIDPSRLPGMNCGPDFTPSFANLGRPGVGGGSRGPPPGMGVGIGGPRRSQQMQRKEPRKIITSMSLNEDVKLNKAEKAWKPSMKKGARGGLAGEDAAENDPEQLKTQELFKKVRSILNKLTPQKFQQLMKQVTELTIDTEERLKGVIDLTFEKAISEPDFSVAYANMCRCVMGLKVEATDKPGDTVNFRKLLLNRCQNEFEKDKDDNVIFEKKQQELEAAGDEEKQKLIEELEDAKNKARKRSLGNIKFIGELFKLKMLTEVIMHECIVKLLKNHDEESLECLCRLLSTIGKDLDFEKAKPLMDQYFKQMGKIIKEKKTSSRIRFMLQDVMDLRRRNWVPRRGDQGPKTIDQIHKEAEMEEHREQMKVQHALSSKKESFGGPGNRMGGGGPGNRGGSHTPGRGGPPQDDGWNTVPISKNRTYDAKLKFPKAPAFDIHTPCLAPGGKGALSWGRGSSGGSTNKLPDSGAELGSRPATNRFSALQQASSGTSAESDKRVPQRNSSSRERGERFDRSDRAERGFDRRDDRERNRPQVAATRTFSRENEEPSRERERRGSADPVRKVANRTDDRDRGSKERAQSRDKVRRETAATPPPPLQTTTQPALTVEELIKKSKAIIEEYLHILDIKEALQCVQEINCPQLLSAFVQFGLESTLERNTITRENLGRLMHQLIKTSILPTEQYYKGLHEILEIADEMAIDIPHIWTYLAELITPMLHEGGIPMGHLFKEISKPLIALGKAGDLLVCILTLLCKGMSHNKVGTMWREAELQWKDFLPEDVDVNKFVTEKNMVFTLAEVSEKSKPKKMSSADLSKQLERLIQDKADNKRMIDWIEANLDEQQTSSNMFVRVLMTCICQSAIICENPYKVNEEIINQRAKLLQKFLKDEQMELQALYALQALMVHMEQPANLLRMFFDTLYDEEVIKDDAFYKWESCKDPAEQQGKGVALKSVTGFFTWLRKEDDSDNS